MKRIVLFLFLIHFTGFAQTKPEVRTNDLKKNLTFLSSDKLKGRLLGSEGIEKAAQYIERVFKNAGLKPYYETYQDTFQFKNKTGYNLIAYQEGNDPKLKHEIVMLGAHYDHIGVLAPVKGDSIANGANDNASGTVAVLELAKYFADKKTKRSMLFVLFSGEEEGLIGSTHLAKRLKKKKVSLYAMLNFEMIGISLKHTDYTAYLTGYKLSNLAKTFNRYAGKEVLGFLPQAKRLHLFKRSDNYAFYKEFHIPAQTLSTFDFTNFNQYHKMGDEIELVDFPAIKELIEETILGIEGLVNSPKDEIKMN